MPKRPRPTRTTLNGEPTSVWQRLGVWRSGLRSSMRRYTRDVFYHETKSLRRTREASEARERAERELGIIQHRWPGAHATFAEAWNAIPATDGLDALAWLGHCSVLLKVHGLTILTDPVLSPKIGVRIGPVMVGPRRLCPAVPTSDLPRPDLVLISHAHFDHLDKPTLRRIAHPETLVIAAHKTGPIIPRGFKDVRELDWGGHFVMPTGVRIEAVQPRHWGARSAWDRHRGYNSYVIRPGPGEPGVLFAGDTAYTEDFAQVAPIDLAIMGIGAYNPWEHVHATPEQALDMARHAGAARLLPVHHSTFTLSDEPLHEPLERLHAAAKKHGGNGTKVPEIVHAPIGYIVAFT